MLAAAHELVAEQGYDVIATGGHQLLEARFARVMPRHFQEIGASGVFYGKPCRARFQ